MSRTETTIIPGWFDKDYYSRAKLAAIRVTDAGYTAERMAAAFAAAGFGGDDGMFRHFLACGHGEELAPNAFFNAEEYYIAKAANYYGRRTVSESEVRHVKQGIHDAGMDAWTHYVACGAAEGVNPSNSFDADAYLAAKLAKVQETLPSMTLADVKAAIASIGMTPLSHYLCYGKGEGIIRDENLLAVTDAITVTPSAVDPAPPTPPVDPPALPTIELSGSQYHSLMRADFAPGTGEGRVVLNSVSTGKGLYVGNTGNLALYLRGRNVIEEDDTPYDDAVYAANMLGTVTITGDAGASLAVEGIRADTVNASGLNGSLRISLSDRHATTVIGSQGNDYFETDGMADTITGGSGNDVFRIGEGFDGPFSAWALGRVPTVTDFSRGDTIDFSEASWRFQGFASQGQRSVGSEQELVNVIRDYLAGAETGILVVHHGGNTYLAANGDARDTDDDAVVRLIGTYEQGELALTGADISIA